MATKTNTKAKSNTSKRKNGSGKTTKKPSHAKKKKDTQKINFSIFIGLVVSLLSVIFIYFTPAGSMVGMIKSFFKGLFGNFAYTIPVLTVTATVYLIKKRDLDRIKIKLWLMLAMLSLASALFHLPQTEFIDLTIAYDCGASDIGGGGFIGALLACPLSALISSIGAGVVYAALFIILFCVATKISIIDAVITFFEGFSQEIEDMREVDATEIGKKTKQAVHNNVRKIKNTALQPIKQKTIDLPLETPTAEPVNTQVTQEPVAVQEKPVVTIQPDIFKPYNWQSYSASIGNDDDINDVDEIVAADELEVVSSEDDDIRFDGRDYPELAYDFEKDFSDDDEIESIDYQSVLTENENSDNHMIIADTESELEETEEFETIPEFVRTSAVADDEINDFYEETDIDDDLTEEDYTGDYTYENDSKFESENDNTSFIDSDDEEFCYDNDYEPPYIDTDYDKINSAVHTNDYSVRSDEKETEREKNENIKEQGYVDLPKQANKLTQEEQNDIEQSISDELEKPVKEYVFPPINLLKKPTAPSSDLRYEMQQTAIKLVETFKNFGVEVKVLQVTQGPAVTRYEIQPAIGVKLKKITDLANDLALNLAVSSVLIAPVPGKAAIGIEVPNKETSAVLARELIDTSEFVNAKSNLTVAWGKDIGGRIVVGDIAKMPHILIAGQTGSGKSVCINTLITSILYKAHPDDVKLIMIDPKVVELGVYNGIPHLLIPVVTDPKKAAGSLSWAVTEMLKRYDMFAATKVRNITGYNHYADKNGLAKLPQIVIIIDELADLMMVAAKEVEDYICRLAQLARAAGIHLVIATQRPSVDVITGLIKANVPSRIAFTTASQTDSRTILDRGGAEKLLGRGDMLYYPSGLPSPLRVQGAFVSDDEVESIVEFLKANTENTSYREDLAEEIERHSAGETGHEPDVQDETDKLLPQAIDLAFKNGQISTSMVQRRLSVGYARAGRIIDQMEERGIISGANGAKPRQLLVTPAELHINSGGINET